MVPKPMDQGIFITFEGSEGCGKTTQFERLSTRLRAAGGQRPVRTLREPGGTPVGEEIRRLLKFTAPDWTILPEAELLLFAASRAQLVREIIRPALEAGETVMCDRFLDSTTVYQGVARRLAAGDVAAINHFAAGSLRPDITFLLDLPTEAARQRSSRRGLHEGTDPDRMEQEPMAFYEQVRRGYLELAAAHPERFVVVDAAGTPDDTETFIWKQLIARFHVLRSSGCA